LIEFATARDAQFALQATQSAGGQTQSGNSQTGQISLRIARTRPGAFPSR
jgi:hypothetical protein